MRELQSPMQRYPPVITMNQAVSQKQRDIYVYILGDDIHDNVYTSIHLDADILS